MTLRRKALAGALADPPRVARRSALAGSVIVISAQALRMLIQLGVAAILARILLPADFGLVVMATAITGLVGLLSGLGLSTAFIQRPDLDQDIASGLFLANVAIGCAAMLAGWLLAPVAAHLSAEPRIAGIIRLQSLAFPLAAFGAMHRALFLRRLQWGRVHAIDLSAALLGGMLAIAFAANLGYGYWSLTFGALATTAISAAMLWLTSPWRPTKVRDWAGARSAIGFGLHLTGFDFLNYFHRSFDKFLLGAVAGASAAGYYGRAYSLFLLPLTGFAWPMSAVMVPVLSRRHDDAERWSGSFLMGLWGVCAVTTPLALLLWQFAPEIVLLIYGPNWDVTADVLAILGPAIALQPIYSAAGWIFLSRGEGGRLLRAGLPATAVFLGAFCIGIRHGPTGLALAYLLSSLLVMPAWIWFALRDTPLSPVLVLRTIGPVLLTGLVAALAARQLAWLGAGTSIAALLGIYAAGLLLIIRRDPMLDNVAQRIRTGLRHWPLRRLRS